MLAKLKSKTGMIAAGFVLALAGAGTSQAYSACQGCLITYYDCIDAGGPGCSLRLSQCLRAAGCSQI